MLRVVKGEIQRTMGLVLVAHERLHHEEAVAARQEGRDVVIALSADEWRALTDEAGKTPPAAGRARLLVVRLAVVEVEVGGETEPAMPVDGG